MYQQVKQLRNLVDICNEFDVVLLDTHILYDPSTGLSPRLPIDQRVHAAVRNTQFIKEFIGFIERIGIDVSNYIYLTEGVYGEYTHNLDLTHKKRIKRADKWKTRGKYVSAELLRERAREGKEKRRLIDLFSDRGMIFELLPQEREIYTRLSGQYSWLRNHYGLTETDFDLLLTAVTVSKLGDKTALITSDRKIKHAKRELLRRSEYDAENLRCFSRDYNLDFSEAN